MEASVRTGGYSRSSDTGSQSPGGGNGGREILRDKYCKGSADSIAGTS